VLSFGSMGWFKNKGEVIPEAIGVTALATLGVFGFRKFARTDVSAKISSIPIVGNVYTGVVSIFEGAFGA
jgi:hypothetical protein